MQQDEIPAGQEAYIVWEVNAQGKRGHKSGLLSWSQARILREALPTITGRSHCPYEIVPAGERLAEQEDEKLDTAPH